MSKFFVNDKVTPLVAPGFPEIHPHVSEGSIYLILKAEEDYVEIVDDLGVKSWWSNAWFKKPDEVKTNSAESLRNRFLEIEKEEAEISKKIDTLSQEKGKIEDDLRLMGFMLCSTNQEDFMPIVDDTPEIDYTDWRNWKKGDMVECVSDEGWGGAFTSGGIYPVSDKSGHGICVESEYGQQEITLFNDDFKFHSPF